MNRAKPHPRLASSNAQGQCVVSPSYGTIPLDFLTTGDAHPCPYLAERAAREEFFVAQRFPAELYHDFMDHGFRRSGRIIYRPICQTCGECRPIRVPAAAFTPNKSQRRVLRKNEDVEIRVDVPRFSRDKHRMYSDYLLMKHGTASDESLVHLRDSLYSSPVQTIEFEYRVKRRVVGVGIVDLCSRSLSSVYMFYDPDCSARSLGTFSAMQEVFFSRDHSIAHYYLGFFVRECPSMNYKERFRPHEILDRSNNWVRRERERGQAHSGRSGSRGPLDWQVAEESCHANVQSKK